MAAASAAELAHDARSLIAAVNVYCELLSGPGVLAPGFRHYAEDLRRVGQTGARLVEALAGTLPSNRPLEARAAVLEACPGGSLPAGTGAAGRSAAGLSGDDLSGDDRPVADLPFPRRRCFPAIDDLAAEVEGLEAPLRALAGPGVRLEVECAPCAGLLGLNTEDLLRILFNLVSNAVEAMARPSMPPTRRRFLRITAQRGGGTSFLPGAADGGHSTVVLSVRDNGPGIPARHLDRIFEPGFSTRPSEGPAALPFPADQVHVLRPKGLGLAIVRRLVEGAGGAVRAISTPGLGTRFDIELPVLAAGGGSPAVDLFASRKAMGGRVSPSARAAARLTSQSGKAVPGARISTRKK
jgi:signal transduction histidine kinase